MSVSQFAAEDGEGFWSEPPEWLGEGEPEDSEKPVRRVPGPVAEWAPERVPERVPGPVPGPVGAGADVPVHAPVPAVVPERVPVAVPVVAPVVVPGPAVVPVPVPVPPVVPVPVPVPAPRRRAPAAVAVPRDEPVGERSFEAVEAERVLLSLRRGTKQLSLGLREARVLVDLAAEWLRRGVSTADLRQTLISWLPEEGVYSPVGFLRYRLEHKMPAERGHFDALAAAASGVRPGGSSGGSPGAASVAASRPQGVDGNPLAEPPYVAPYEPPLPLVTCEGPGDEHVFRATGGETKCGACRSAEAWEAWAASRNAAARAQGKEGLTGNGKGGWRDVHVGAAVAPGADADSGEEAAAYAALGL
ncbi:hypothetical protein [Streptomyces sp. NPDC002690]